MEIMTHEIKRCLGSVRMSLWHYRSSITTSPPFSQAVGNALVDILDNHPEARGLPDRSDSDKLLDLILGVGAVFALEEPLPESLWEALVDLENEANRLANILAERANKGA